MIFKNKIFRRKLRLLRVTAFRVHFVHAAVTRRAPHSPQTSLFLAQHVSLLLAMILLKTIPDGFELDHPQHCCSLKGKATKI